MRMRDGSIRKLNAYTESGMKLGRVTAIEIDVDDHAVRAYVVSKSRLLRVDEVLIAPSQVISIDEKRMVVSDALIAESMLKEIVQPVHNSSPLPGSARNME